MGIEPTVMGAVCRWGGWSQRQGHHTVASTYESVALDEHINTFGLAYGLGTESEVWERRLRDFQGQVIRPTTPIRDRGHTVLPWDKWVDAMRDAAVVVARADCNVACERLMRAAEAVAPVRRFCDSRSALSSYRRQNPECQLVAEADASMQRLKCSVQRSVTDIVAMFREDMINAMGRRGYSLRVRDPARLSEFSLAYSSLLPSGDGVALFVDRMNRRDTRASAFFDLMGTAGFGDLWTLK